MSVSLRVLVCIASISCAFGCGDKDEGADTSAGDVPEDTAAADLDMDGQGEFLVVGNGQATLFEADCAVSMSWTLPGGGSGGPPTIAVDDGEDLTRRFDEAHGGDLGLLDRDNIFEIDDSGSVVEREVKFYENYGSSGGSWREFLGRRAWFVLHSFAGADRAGSFRRLVEALGEALGLWVVVVDVDHEQDAGWDLCDPVVMSALLDWIEQGLIDILLGGPPCSSWSRARFHGRDPPPLRGRHLHAWG